MDDGKKLERQSCGGTSHTHQDYTSQSRPPMSSKHLPKIVNAIFINWSSYEDEDVTRSRNKSANKSISPRSSVVKAVVKRYTFEGYSQSLLAPLLVTDGRSSPKDKCVDKSIADLHQKNLMNRYNENMDKQSLNVDICSAAGASSAVSSNTSYKKLPSSLVPSLVEQLFQKYEAKFNKQQKQQTAAFDSLKKQLLVELDVFFGDVLTETLELLDQGATITLHRSAQLTREIAEIRLKRYNLLQLMYLYPNVNYCCCADFKRGRMQHSKQLYEKGILKNVMMITQKQYSNFKFVGRLDQMKVLYTGIRALNFGVHTGTFQISEEGLRITVESGNSVQASLYITASCFSEFNIDGMVNFSLDINVMTECLGLFAGINSAVKMYYKGPDAPLIIAMKPHDENDISAECSIKTLRCEELIDFNLDGESASMNTLFIRGPELANIFQELDKSAEELRVTLSPQRPYFKIETLGVMHAESSVEVAKSSGMILLFNCRETTSARYRSANIRLMQKALAASTKVAIKTDASGLLEMHLMMQSDDQAEAYVQFYMEPLI